MGKLTSIALWAGFGFVVGYAGVMAYEFIFASGVLNLVSRNCGAGGTAGAVVGGVIGLFKRG